MKPIRCTLRELEPILVGILADLMASDLERRPYVIVEEPLTKRFVQFARRFKPKTGELCFDVPKLNIYLQSCPSPKMGAIWATTTLSGAFELPADADLRITIGGDTLS